MLSPLHLYLLGDFRLLSGDAPVMTVNSLRQQSLLAYLVLHRTAPLDRSHLAFLLWPDATETHAHANLRKLLHQLRQAFPTIDHFLHADRLTLAWQPAADLLWTFDVLDFEQALTQAEQAERDQDTAALRQALERAAGLYHGDLLPGCYDEWIVPERDRIRQLFFQTLERLLRLLEEEREYDAAIKAARRLLRYDPLHEETYRLLMRLYALCGNRAAALRTYHTSVTVLERELGTGPSEATRAAYEALVRSDTAPVTQTGPLTARRTAPPLLGRKVEWRQLQEEWRKAASGRPHIVILTGEPGIGKTRLAEELEVWVSRQGMTTVSSRCYTALEQLAYAPVTTWLRTDALQSVLSTFDPTRLTEIARLLPEVLATHAKLPRPTSMTEGWQRQHFFEALARTLLSARQPLLLLLDDLQWCDNETLAWLQYLFRFEPGARLLLVGTVRAEELQPGHPLVAFLRALQHDRLVTEIPLGRLTAAETASLAEHITGRPLAAMVGDTLFHETEGNPLFVVEMARADTLGRHAGGQTEAKSLPLLLPPVVQAVLAERLAQLSPLARQVANVAAVIGREFSFAVLAQTSSEDEEVTVRGLDELWQRRLVREQGTGAAETYDFSHDKLRELVYASLSPTSRRLLHRRVAEAFQAVYVEDQDMVSGQIAVHYERGHLPERAIHYYLQAGEAERRIYANAAAQHAFERAVALLKTYTPGSARQAVPWMTAVQVYTSLGDLFMTTGRYEDARQAFQSAITYIPEQAYLWQARLQGRLARTWNFVSTNPHDTFHVNALQAFQAAERILQQQPEPANPVWRDEWVELHFAQLFPLRGSVDDMTATIEKVRPAIVQYGTAEQRKLFSEVEGLRNLIRSRFTASEEALASRRAALAELQQTDDMGEIGTGHLALGIILLWADHLDEAEEHLGSALRIAEQTGIVWLRTRSLTFLPFIFRKRGQVEEVRYLLARAQNTEAAQRNSIISGHYAWLALRDGNLTEAEAYAQRSVEEGRHQQMEINPFQWVGLWPLLGVALTQGKIAVAIDHVSMLLAPTQQPPPAQLRTLLETAQHAWEAGQQAEAQALLQQAVPLAEQMGYL